MPSPTPVVTRSPYHRLTVLAPHRRADVALPADVPVAELVPMLLDLLGGAAGPVPWQLTSAAGAVLPPGATLDALGVLDGEVLRLAPLAPAPPAPVLDDPVDALAQASTAVPGGDGSRLRAAAVGVAATLAAVLLALVRSPGTGWLLAASTAALAGLAAIAALFVAARSAADGELAGARTAALAAVPLAAAAGWAILPPPVGGGQLLLAAAAAGSTAAAGQIAVRVVTPGLVAVALVAAFAAVGGLAGTLLGASTGAVAAVTATVALAAGPLLPRSAMRLAGLPRPMVPADAGELIGAGVTLMPPDELADRAELARGLLVGAIGGTATVAAVGAVLAAPTGGWAGPTLGGVVALVLALRSRGVSAPGGVLALRLAAASTAVGVAVPAATAAGPVAVLGVAVALLVAAAAAARPGRPTPSPVARRAVDLLEIGLVTLALPLALGVAGVYGLVHGR